MKNKIFILILSLAVMGLYSCEKLHDLNQQDEPEVEVSSTYPLSGEWWVKWHVDPELTTDIMGGYSPLYTYNTAANDGKAMWIWDMDYFWWFRIKCPVNMTTKTFSGNQIVSTTDDYPIWVSVTNGKVIEKGGESTSGVVVDSIYLELEFEDDEGTIYYGAGHRRTGFLEDEH